MEFVVSHYAVLLWLLTTGVISVVAYWVGLGTYPRFRNAWMHPDLVARFRRKGGWPGPTTTEPDLPKDVIVMVGRLTYAKAAAVDPDRRAHLQDAIGPRSVPRRTPVSDDDFVGPWQLPPE